MIRIRGLTSLAFYPRQRLKKLAPNGKTQIVIPVNDFFQDVRPGIGVVSRNTEQEIIDTVTEHSYRKTETIVKKALGRETIRRGVWQRGEKAKTLPAVRREERIIPEAKLKDAEGPAASYRKSRGSAVRRLVGRILNLQRLYLFVDGVGVFLKEKGDNGEASRECKVAAIVRQNDEIITETASWCTWGRIRAFRALTQTAWLAVTAVAGLEIVIVSDGAKWIRNMRRWVTALKDALWILDWFHLKDHALKCLHVFKIEEASEIAQRLLSLLWRGQADEAAQIIRELPVNDDGAKRSEEEAAVKKFLIYLNNQREGIVDYEAYQRRGYIVGSGFVEKLNDTLIKSRMVHGKRMRWSLKGGEAMMALLSAKHNGRLAEVFA